MDRSNLSKLSAAILILVFAATWPGLASAVDKTIVFIQCTGTDGTVKRGSGVIVSAQGHVLTAGHQVPDGSRCVGSIGVAEDPPTTPLIIQPTNLPVDLARLRFSQYDGDLFARYCKLEDWMVRRRVIVSGFPGDTKTFVPSFREGIISTMLPNASGIIETDGPMVRGMSGGPVYSRNLAGLVGLVVRGDNNALGQWSYGALPVWEYADVLGLTPSERPCFHKSREVDFTDPETGEWNAKWTAGDPEIDLEIGVDEGFCFLAGVSGNLNDQNDYVRIEVVDGRYFLDGGNRAGGSHGATARCIWYE